MKVPIANLCAAAYKLLERLHKDSQLALLWGGGMSKLSISKTITKLRCALVTRATIRGGPKCRSERESVRN